MYFACFLHFYQPYFQHDDILERIVNESYRPLMRIFLNNPQARATFNVNGALLELLAEKGFQDVVDSIRELVGRQQVELTGSAAYHAFLPLFPKEEAVRQVRLNTQIYRKYLGDLYRPRGFFSPELAFDYKTARIISGMGYRWMLAPQIAYGSQAPVPDRVFELKEPPI